MDQLPNYLNHDWPTTREAERRKLDVPIRVQHHESELRGWCNDVSTGGIGFTVAAAFKTGDELLVEFTLPDDTAILKSSVVVRWSDGFRHGCEFLKSSAELFDAVTQFMSRPEHDPKKKKKITKI